MTHPQAQGPKPPRGFMASGWAWPPMTARRWRQPSQRGSSSARSSWRREDPVPGARGSDIGKEPTRGFPQKCGKPNRRDGFFQGSVIPILIPWLRTSKFFGVKLPLKSTALVYDGSRMIPPEAPFLKEATKVPKWVLGAIPQCDLHTCPCASTVFLGRARLLLCSLPSQQQDTQRLPRNAQQRRFCIK